MLSQYFTVTSEARLSRCDSRPGGIVSRGLPRTGPARRVKAVRAVVVKTLKSMMLMLERVLIW